MTQIDYIITGLLFGAVTELQDTTPWELFPDPSSLRYRCDEALAEMSVHMRSFDGIALFKLKWRLLNEAAYPHEEYQVLTWTGADWQVQV